MNNRFPIVAALAVAWTVSVASAQEGTWVRVAPNAPPTLHHTMVYDSLRGVTVLCARDEETQDGFQTWEWDGAWVRRTLLTVPPTRIGFAAAFDAARGETVVFGGVDDGTLFGDTWTWDGIDWTQESPAVAPTPREGHAMAYDSARGVVVLFGGEDQGGLLGDTWEWDGTTWALRTPAVSPPAVHHTLHMVYDAARTVTTLLATEDFADPFAPGQTWEWDGATWSQATPVNSPEQAFVGAMAYDSVRQRVVANGSDFPVDGQRQTWEWDGVDWTLMSPDPNIGGLQHHAMSFDAVRARVLLWGGRPAAPISVGPTWELYTWDGVGWHAFEPAQHLNSGRVGSIVYDAARAELMFFGGSTNRQTWIWNGLEWGQRLTANAPTPRFGHAVAYDAARERAVLFGGELDGAYTGDTWEWDGVDWVQRVTANAPSPRSGHLMTYDAARGVVVLVGGGTDVADFPETWEFDGVDWVQRTPLTHPGVLTRAAMAYDPSTQRTLLIGQSFFSFHDVWEWDGVSWELRFTSNGDVQRQLVYDSAREQMHLGSRFFGPGPATWRLSIWSGTNFWPVPVGNPPYVGASVAMAYDAARDRIVAWASPNQFVGLPGATWLYQPIALATFERFGSGCPGTFFTPSLRSLTRPIVGMVLENEILFLPNDPTRVPFGLIGLSRDSVGGVPLPVDLTPLGMPGCELLVSADSFEQLQNDFGVAHWNIGIPNLPALAGGRYYLQSLVLDPGANAAGMITSNGIAVRIGFR